MGLFETRVSYADLEQAPEDGRRYELYDGEVRVVPSPLPRHQIVSLALLQVLLAHSHTAGGLVLAAPLDIVFTDYDVLQPDLVYFGPARRHLVEPDWPIRSAPDLVIEILLPSTEGIDRGYADVVRAAKVEGLEFAAALAFRRL